MSAHRLDQATMRRRRFGGAKTLLKRLRDSDEAFDVHCPDGRVDLLDNKRLRLLAAAVGVDQGDRTDRILLENLWQFKRMQHLNQMRRAEEQDADESKLPWH